MRPRISVGTSVRSAAALTLAMAGAWGAAPMIAQAAVPGTVSGIEWWDVNGDGTRQASEPALAGQTVNLYLAGNTTTPIAAAQTTAANGSYSFAGLAAGDYRVVFTAPAGMTASPSTAAAGADVTVSDTTDPVADAGWVGTGTLTGTVYYDVDGVAGYASAFDVPQGDQTVGLLDGSGTQIATATTNTNTGLYTFEKIKPGTYQLAIAGDGLFATTTRTVTVAANGTVTTDIPVDLVPTIYGQVWDDADADGHFAGEDGLPSVTVTLTDSTGTKTTTTDSSGYYEFQDMPEGTYTVSFTAPTGYFTNALKDSAGASQSVTISRSDPVQEVDSGMLRAARLHGVVFADKNGNRSYDSGEKVIPGSVLRLTGPQGDTVQVSPTATTAADGTYAIANLKPGTYAATLTFPASYKSVLGGSQVTGSVTIEPGENAVANGWVEPLTKDVDCGDFTSQPSAQQVYNLYKPLFGDVFNLDADSDGVACEALASTNGSGSNASGGSGTGSTGSGSSATLAETGTNVTPQLAVALGLIGGGVGLIRRSRAWRPVIVTRRAGGLRRWIG